MAAVRSAMAARAASRAVTRGAQFSAVCRVAGDPVSGTFPVRVQAFGRSLRGQLRLFSSAAAKDAGAEVFDHPDARKAVLVLEDGTKLEGVSFGAPVGIHGEVVFTTGMVGYPESLTDPSYRGQILVSTYPLAGNYGVPDTAATDATGLSKFHESSRIQASGFICQDYSYTHSHWNAKTSLAKWLRDEGVPGIHGIDTRALTKKIRAHGAMLGRIEIEGEAMSDAARVAATEGVGATEASAAGAGKPFPDPNLRNLVAEVSIKEPKVYGEGNGLRILAVDCGMKNNMIRTMVGMGAEVKVVPWDWDLASEIKAGSVDGLFISNGPGDPAVLTPLIDNVRTVLELPEEEMVPIFGICLGNQVTGLAAGCSSYKLPFGNRGQNQPVVNLLTGSAFITPQNHGYAIDPKSLAEGWQPLFENVNDGTNEGIMHTSKPFFTAQFHPEAKGGPVDTAFLFDVFLKSVGQAKAGNKGPISMPKPVPHDRPKVRKVLLLGSGGLSIGQAGEFDYSGAQAIKALKEEGIEVVLMNPNIASVQTNLTGTTANGQADEVYFLPVTPDFIEMVIKRERPDGIMISMGGQTALNCGVELDKNGVLEKYGVRVLGTSVQAIKNTEDRDIFASKLKEIGEKLAPSVATDNIEDAVKAAEGIGYPVMIRSAYALGGLGSGICTDEEHLREMASKALAVAPQILVEKSLKGWKEVEYEVVRDAADNCITVCNMENFDPLGVHTGDSIVIAPSQTLSNEEYHMLRETAIKVVRHCGIVGECNIQYALDPHSLDYCIIEVNARLSRSSALASKATGYPLAAVAARLALGVTLPEIKNAVTKVTSACFEPSLDYVVTKIPRWDLAKFAGVNQEIGSAMKSVGEVMAIGRSFEESFQKAMRMVDPGIEGFEPRGDYSNPEALLRELTRPTDKRPAAIAWALQHGTHTMEEVHDLSKIDRWFLARLKRMHDAGVVARQAVSRARTELGESASALEISRAALASIDKAEMRKLKMLGFSDRQIAGFLKESQVASEEGADDDKAWASSAIAAAEAGVQEMDVRTRRKALGVVPVAKQIDTLAAEYPAQTNYLYTTYAGDENDVEASKDGVMVLGSGTYRIGSSVEFDWCSVSAIRTLRELGRTTIVVNYNPETVSTDYDESDRLYFEELSKERVLDIYEAETADGIIVSVGGQIPNNLALPLHREGVKVLGTSPEMIDSAEDRFKFSSLMDSAGVKQPAWKELTTLADAKGFAERVGFPVLVRPSYVLSGAAMSVAHNDEELARILANAASVSPEHPVVITKFHDDALEIEFDGVAKDGKVIAHAISEHVEQAGVHSGDATLVLPPQTLSPYYTTQVRDIAARVASTLKITGPFNMQLLADGADVLVIECNLRASRSFPFVSKTVGSDFIAAATKAMVDADTSKDGLPDLTCGPRPSNFVGIKCPMFSFTRLGGADPVLGVEMASTGEVACFGKDKHEAFLKSLMASTFSLPKKAILVSTPASDHHKLVHPIFKLATLGFKIYATDDTHTFLSEHGIESTMVPLPSNAQDTKSPLMQAIRGRDVDLVVSVPSRTATNPTGEFMMRRVATDYNVPLLTNLNLVVMLADALEKHSQEPMVAPRARQAGRVLRQGAPQRRLDRTQGVPLNA
ncbi:hypothetical protein FNF28_04925 [Cafeteria roenbergensis]|uniref:Carbamoyl phosphate synthase arginine-specific large chain n=1 Tax=Cafeteria roenbergensis TaxID=33653 RepID=A0A5A8DCE0_CAFRO|nr:hypothetical protein FNF28_04925 [Cafeteria roenbergensis]